MHGAEWCGQWCLLSLESRENILGWPRLLFEVIGMRVREVFRFYYHRRRNGWGWGWGRGWGWGHGGWGHGWGHGGWGRGWGHGGW